jgi:hypothetical protein
MVIAVAIMVPPVIVFDAPMIAIPIPFVEIPAIVVGTNPTRTHIRRTGPVSLMPDVAARYRVPISRHPLVAGTGTRRDGNNSGRRGRPNIDSNRYGA